MNDYFVDEKLIREFREAEPVPYKLPNKFTNNKFQNTPNNNSNLPLNKLSANPAAMKKELADLDAKFRNLDKVHQKVNKKASELSEEVKILKSTNDQLIKELNILQISNEKILLEKSQYEITLEENKSYIRKLESRLVQGAKNQYLVEINNKMRKEMEQMPKQVEERIQEVEKIKNELTKKNQEIKILTKAVEIKVDEMKYAKHGDIKTTLLIDCGMVKQEMDECKSELEKEIKKTNQLSKQFEDKSQKIQELSFAKAHLAELLIENENKMNSLEVERDSFEKALLDCKEERNMLRDYVDKISSEFNAEISEMNSENENLKSENSSLQITLNNREEVIKKLNIENEAFKSQNSSLLEKNKSNEINLKTKNNLQLELENKVKTFEKSLTISDERKEELERDVSNLVNEIEKLNKSLQSLEKENFELLRKNKNMMMNQENLQNDLVKHNQQLTTHESRLKEQVSKMNSEIELLKEERENLKKVVNETIQKCSQLIKEKSELETDLVKKSNQVENLKNTNQLLHKKINLAYNRDNVTSLHSNTQSPILTNNMDEDQMYLKLGEQKIDENNMINLIRKEKEKNKEFLEEIKKIKNNLNY
jgi:chromosome segregation ATPase